MPRPIREAVADLMENEPARAGATRPALFRIYRIHEAVRAGGFPNCSKLAAILEVTPKTIQRDVSYMRDMLDLPIEYDAVQHGFHYTRDTSDFPIFETTADQLAGLFLARTALEAVRNTPLANTMREVFAKLTQGIEGRVSFSWGDLDEAFSRKAVEAHPRDVKVFGELADSVMKRLEVTFAYRKLGAETAETRRVRPYHLGEVEGGWYLIAHDLERDALRTFALPRVTRLKVTAKNFERPIEFDGKAHLGKSFGVWSVAGDSTRHLVRVELSNYAAQLASERRWHPSQEITSLNAKGTRVEVRFEVGRLEEVLRWVLSFGRQAKVLGPPELSRMVKDELAAMQGRHLPS